MDTQDLSPVVVNCEFLLPPDTIFDAWIKPETIRKWLFVGAATEITAVEVDLKIGGRFSIREFDKTNNDYIDHFGYYIEIDRPSRLVFSLYVPQRFHGEAIVSITIERSGNGSELKLVQTGVSKDMYGESWEKMLEQLKWSLEIQ